MAEAAGGVDNSWRTQAFRQKVRAQIEDAMRQAGNPTNKTCNEMENHVFQRAKSREEYMALVARLILHVRDIRLQVDGSQVDGSQVDGLQRTIDSKKDKQGGRGMGMGAVGMQDPINALQNLTKTGMGPQGMMGMQTGVMPQGMQMQPGIQGMQAMQGMAQQSMPQGMPQGMAQMQPGISQGMQGMPQQGIPQQGMPQQAMGMPQQGMPRQGIPQGMNQMQQGMGMPQMGGMQQMQPGQMQAMQRQPFQAYQLPQMGVRPGMPQVAMQMPSSQPGPPQQTGVPSPSPGQSYPYLQSPSSVTFNTWNTSGATNIPSPAHMLPSPSPGQIVPSPASRMSVASPGSALNTPGNPSSVAPSPRAGTDEQVYLDKWQQLRKYIEPLKRMISRLEKDEERRKDVSKMMNLLKILSDSTQRLPFATLLKCEQVLEKMDFQTKSSTPAPETTAVKTEQHMCQPLLDAVARHIQSPTLNHTLKRTFGPAIQALHGSTPKPPSPPPKKAKTEDDQNGEVSNLLQGEIARLDGRFKVSLDPLYHNGSNTVHLICRLDDKNLPSVPPLNITVPENYPDSSPTCDNSPDESDATPFLRTIKKTLSDQLQKLPDKYSITALLDIWEMGVRQACSPVSTTTK